MIGQHLAIFILFCAYEALAFPNPIFGTKRYHRAANLKHIVNPAPAQYYDDPYIPMSSYSDYQDDSYYYLPRRDQHYYGLPTYRGEYKPTPYYYAHGPSYSYYDDREQANPLDDLHEEMLQEDQRERQREIPYGQETWYEKPSRQDKLTNAFLKNLVLYNKQINRQQQLENNGKEFEDYNDGSEYYEQLAPQDPYMDDYDIQNYDGNVRQQTFVPSSKLAPAAKTTTTTDEDKDVRELKLLANKHSSFRHRNLHDEFPNNHPFTNTRELDQFANSHHMDQYTNNNNNRQQYDQITKNYQPTPSDYMQDSYESEPEYDEDDEWINWDKKRSADIKPIVKSKVLFNARKPSPVVAYFQKSNPTMKPTASPSVVKSSTAEPMPVKSKLPTGGAARYSGQKEVVLPRPASPVRHPFSEPVMDMLTHNSIQEKREIKKSDEPPEKSTNVYGTIKQLLAMEQSLNKVS